MSHIMQRRVRRLLRQATQLLAAEDDIKGNKYYQALRALMLASLKTGENNQIGVFEGVEISYYGHYVVANETGGNILYSARLLEKCVKAVSADARALIRACPGAAVRRIEKSPDVQEVGYPKFREDYSPRIAIFTAARPEQRLRYQESDFDYPGELVSFDEAVKLLRASKMAG